MIEGVVVVNSLTPPHADRLRSELWQAVGGEPASTIAVA
jgi:hypothetical protein